MTGHVQVYEINRENNFEVRKISEKVEFPSEYRIVFAADAKETLKSAEVEQAALREAGKAGLHRPSLSAMVRPVYAVDSEGAATNAGKNVREFRREFVIYGDV